MIHSLTAFQASLWHCRRPDIFSIWPSFRKRESLLQDAFRCFIYLVSTETFFFKLSTTQFQLVSAFVIWITLKKVKYKSWLESCSFNNLDRSLECGSFIHMRSLSFSSNILYRLYLFCLLSTESLGNWQNPIVDWGTIEVGDMGNN